jgi:hypothetical protein
VRYDAFLSKSGGENRIVLETEAELRKGDDFKHGLDVYSVTSVQPGHDDFDAVLRADWIGDVQPGRFVPDV